MQAELAFGLPALGAICASVLQSRPRLALTAGLVLGLGGVAAIALSDQRSATDPLYVIAVAIGVLAYGWIAWSGVSLAISTDSWAAIICAFVSLAVLVWSQIRNLSIRAR